MKSHFRSCQAVWEKPLAGEEMSEEQLAVVTSITLLGVHLMKRESV